MTNKELWARLTELLGDDEVTRRFRAWANSVIRKELVKRSNMSADELFLKDAMEIVSDLNKRTGCRFTLTCDAKKMIRVIMAAGYTKEDFFRVHQVMVKKWWDEPKMRDFLRPSTLWQLKKFDERLALYAAEKPKSTNAPKHVFKLEPQRQEEANTIAKLLAKPWWDFDSWAELMKWTVQFPDASSLAKYEMPERVRKMRTAPGMVMQVLGGHSPEWAEAEYGALKRDIKKEEKR